MSRPLSHFIHLQDLVIRGDVEAIQRILTTTGEHIDDIHSGFGALLHLAATHNRLEVAKFLVKNGANVELRDGHDETPLQCAAYWGAFDVAQFLVLECNARVDARTKHNKRTALHCALTERIKVRPENRKKLVKLFIENGADVNLTSSLGCTPLHLCALWNIPIDVTRCLLEAGADIDVRNLCFESAQYIASRENKRALVSLLQNARNNSKLCVCGVCFFNTLQGA